MYSKLKIKLLCLLSLMMLAIPAQALPMMQGTWFFTVGLGQDGQKGDFNNDGKLDFLIVAGGPSAMIQVNLGDGAGLFSSSVVDYAPTASALGKVLVRDMNADGNLDLIIEDNVVAGHPVYISLGNGLGGFAPLTAPIFTAAPNVQGLHLADMNNDGNQDLIMFNTVTNSIAVYYYNGATYAAPQLFATGGVTSPQSVFNIQSGDLNGDGNTDLTILLGAVNKVAVFLGNGTQTLAASTLYPTGTTTASGSILTDLNGDSRLDIAILDSNGVGLSVMLNSGLTLPVVFMPAALQPAVSVSGALSSADFNMDGNMDLVTRAAGAVAVLPGDGRGGFGTQVEYATGTSGGAFFVLVGDITNDSKPDIIVSGYGPALPLAVPFINMNAGIVNPIVGTIAINAGDLYTEVSAVTLNLSCVTSANVPCASTTTMQFSNDNTVWSAPVLVAASTPWSLSSGLGTKTVYAKFTDIAGNMSTPSDTIELVVVPAGGGCLAPTQSAFQYLLMLFGLLLVSAQFIPSRKG